MHSSSKKSKNSLSVGKFKPGKGNTQSSVVLVFFQVLPEGHLGLCLNMPRYNQRCAGYIFCKNIDLIQNCRNTEGSLGCLQIFVRVGVDAGVSSSEHGNCTEGRGRGEALGVRTSTSAPGGPQNAIPEAGGA